MIKILVLIFILILITPAAGFSQSKNQEWIQGYNEHNAEKASYDKKILEMIKTINVIKDKAKRNLNKIELNELKASMFQVEKNLRDALITASILASTCDFYLNNPSLCSVVHDAKYIAIMQLQLADTYVKINDIESAKRLYREVITTFTGFEYKSYVKQAEFGLEDIKEKESKRTKW